VLVARLLMGDMYNSRQEQSHSLCRRGENGTDKTKKTLTLMAVQVYAFMWADQLIPGLNFL
jgi:hypothetical protein